MGTPGRVLDFLTGDRARGVHPCLEGDKVKQLVLDEADRMLDMGFIPDVRRIVDFFPPRQTLFFTATWPRSVEAVAKSFVSKDAEHLRIAQEGKLTANRDITQTIEVLGYDDKMDRLREIVRAHSGTCIVFTATKRTCDWMVQELQGSCAWARALHSDKEQWEREETLGAFSNMARQRTERTAVLVATNVAARGLDIPGVPLVVSYDFGGAEEYVHQIGRTARAGAEGRAHCFFDPAFKVASGRGARQGTARELVALLRDAKQAVPDAILNLADAEGGRAAWADRRGKGRGKGKGRRW